VTDEELLARVRDAFAELEPVPARVLAAGRAAFAFREPGSVLAGLTGDHDAAAAGLRGSGLGGTARLLTFAGPDIEVEIEVTGSGADREIAGRVAPPGPARIRVRHPDGELTCQADRTGHFALPAVPAGLVSLVFRLPDATSIVTSWVRL
jgi:hypothetical protein